MNKSSGVCCYTPQPCKCILLANDDYWFPDWLPTGFDPVIQNQLFIYFPPPPPTLQTIFSEPNRLEQIWPLDNTYPFLMYMLKLWTNYYLLGI